MKRDPILCYDASQTRPRIDRPSRESSRRSYVWLFPIRISVIAREFFRFFFPLSILVGNKELFLARRLFRELHVLFIYLFFLIFD